MTVLNFNNGQEVLVEINGEGRPVRQACIQAPLHQQQPWSNQAKSALSEALPQGTAVKMELLARDVYGHVVARLLKENTDIASPLINSGGVFAYDGYWGVRRPELSKTGEFARSRKSGLWAVQGGITRPWDMIEAGGKQVEP